jgi:hypothetical protein
LELHKAKSSKAAERAPSKAASQSGLGPSHPSLSTNSKYEHDSDLSPPRKRQAKAHFEAKKQLDSKGEHKAMHKRTFLLGSVRMSFFWKVLKKERLDLGELKNKRVGGKFHVLLLTHPPHKKAKMGWAQRLRG